MGVHIALKRIVSIEQELTWGGKIIPCAVTEDLDFDTIRHAGDKEFVLGVEFVDLEDPYYVRPMSINSAKEWVKENIQQNLQKRLLDALVAMEKDTNICFKFSY